MSCIGNQTRVSPRLVCLLTCLFLIFRVLHNVEAMKKYSGVYFGAIGGAGALLAKCIKKAELIAYEDLGAEALRKLYVEDMPLVVIIDSEGNNLYEEGRAEYLKGKKN